MNKTKFELEILKNVTHFPRLLKHTDFLKPHEIQEYDWVIHNIKMTNSD